MTGITTHNRPWVNKTMTMSRHHNTSSTTSSTDKCIKIPKPTSLWSSKTINDKIISPV